MLKTSSFGENGEHWNSHSFPLGVRSCIATLEEREFLIELHINLPHNPATPNIFTQLK